MTAPPAIIVDNVSKKFRVVTSSSSYGRLSEAISNAGRRITQLRQPKPTDDSETFWALKDISFEVPTGSAIGLIGHNGAGKSTLLKVISRITRPTTGRIGVAGRVGSLLEVGTGFHPELTGRENTFVNGAVLGMSRREVASKLDEIVAFAEVERFLDTPVKRYSSGMKMRLAFAVAAHLDPEVLLVDEVLAVGDAAFQKKCLGKMGDVAGSGRTIVFVSHNMLAVRKLCQQAIWLDKGHIRQAGSVSDVVAAYSASLETMALNYVWPTNNDPEGDLALRELNIAAADTAADTAVESQRFDIHTSIKLTVDYEIKLPAAPRVGITLVNSDQVPVLFTVTDGTFDEQPSGRYQATVVVPGDLLNDDVYSVTVSLLRNQTEIVQRTENVATFRIEDDADSREGGLGRHIGVVRPPLQWSQTAT